MSLKKFFDVPPYTSCRKETTDFGYDLGPPDGIRLSQTGLLKSGCMILSYKSCSFHIGPSLPECPSMIRLFKCYCISAGVFLCAK